MERELRRKTGKMENWNIGMLGEKNKMPKPIIPSFQFIYAADFARQNCFHFFRTCVNFLGDFLV
jgi:hypothetical protein